MAALTAIAALVAIGTTVTAERKQRRAGRIQRKASRMQRLAATVKASRERRSQVRAALRERALIENRAVQAGVAGSSGAVSGASNITAQSSSNIAFTDQQLVLGQEISSLNQQAADAMSSAATAQAIGGVATQFAGDEGFKQLGGAVKSIFR